MATSGLDLNTQTKGSRMPFFGTDSGSANAYAITTFGPIGSGNVLQSGSRFYFIAANANTGASTLAVDGGSAIAIKKSGSTALASGDIVAGQAVEAVYDGTNFQMLGGSDPNFIGDSGSGGVSGDVPAPAAGDAAALKFLKADGTWASVKDSDLSFTNITTNNVSPSKHGFCPILPGVAGEFLNGNGTWATPAGSGGGGGFLARSTVVKTTGSLAFLATETGTVTIANTFLMLYISSDRAARVQLYSTAAKMTADASRGLVRPAQGSQHGVILDLVIGSALTWIMSPVALGANLESSPSSAISYRIKNYSLTTHTVAVTFTYLIME